MATNIEEVLKAALELKKSGKSLTTQSNYWLDFEDEANMQLFWYWIAERQRIWYKRYILKQPAPWTEDPIFQTFKFTNAYREMDRGTIYYIENILGHHSPGDSEVRNRDIFALLVYRTLVYRHFNNIPTWEAIKKIPMVESVPDWLAIEDALWELPRAYTNAHVVTGFQWAGSYSKIENSMWLLKYWWNNRDNIGLDLWIRRDDMGESWDYLVKEVPGFGGFTGYEVVVDLSYSDFTLFDDDQWVNPGPGCRRGLNRLFPGIGNNRTTCRTAISYLRENQQRYFDRFGINFIKYQGKELTLRNIEHSLCEYSKYAKAYYGEGRPRNRWIYDASKPELVYTNVDAYISSSGSDNVSG